MELTEEDLLISTESAEGYVSASDKGITVALDTRLTPALIEEGIERELVSKLQTMRKEAGFEVTDHIAITHEGNPKVKNGTAVCARRRAGGKSRRIKQRQKNGTAVCGRPGAL